MQINWEHTTGDKLPTGSIAARPRYLADPVKHGDEFNA